MLHSQHDTPLLLFIILFVVSQTLYIQLQAAMASSHETKNHTDIWFEHSYDEVS
jgi:hypothetical protein